MIFLILPSSFLPSPNMFVAVTTNSYSLPFSKLTTTLRSEVSVISFILIQLNDVPSSRTVLRYTVYRVISAPLFSASFHFTVISTSLVSFGKSAISAAAGTPGLNNNWVQSKQKLDVYCHPQCLATHTSANCFSIFNDNILCNKICLLVLQNPCYIFSSYLVF